MQFNKTTEIVKEILDKEPQTRNSDNALYIKVVEKINGTALDKPFWEVMLGLEALGLPCFETVRRTRQKVQAEHPELKPCEKVQDFRTGKEIEYREYFGPKGANT